MAKKKKRKLTPENIAIRRLQKQVFRCADEIIKNVKCFDALDQEKNNKQYLKNCVASSDLMGLVLREISTIAITNKLTGNEIELFDPELLEKKKKRLDEEIKEISATLEKRKSE